MSTITPILDTLLHQVLGRRADMARFTATRPNAPLLAVARLPGARDATTQPGLQPERLLHSRPAGAARGADDGARAANARTSGVLPRAAGNMGTGGARAGAAAPGSAQLHFSPGARAISSLLSQFPAAPMAAAPARAPLFSGVRPPLPRMLAPALVQQLANSGVFYESHLLQWLGGKRSLKQLSQEPQARLNRPGAAGTSPAGQTPSAASALQAPARTVSTPAATTSAPASAAVANSGAAPSGLGAMGGAAAAELIHESLLPVVRQQLDVLSSAVFRWDGLAWPGVPMQWEVQEHEPPPHDPSDDMDDAADASRYSTRLKLELPVLGALEVQITLSADTLQMYAWAASHKGVAALQPHTETLQKRLERAGFDVASVRLLTETPA